MNCRSLLILLVCVGIDLFKNHVHSLRILKEVLSVLTPLIGSAVFSCALYASYFYETPLLAMPDCICYKVECL